MPWAIKRLRIATASGTQQRSAKFGCQAVKTTDKAYCKIEEELAMTQEEEYSQYRERLLTLINSINREIPIEESNQVLIVYKLNTPDKIRKFCKTLKSRLQEGKLKMTEAEIVRAAVQASKESPQ